MSPPPPPPPPRSLGWYVPLVHRVVRKGGEGAKAISKYCILNSLAFTFLLIVGPGEQRDCTVPTLVNFF
jgi:hypothetical protein